MVSEAVDETVSPLRSTLVMEPVRVGLRSLLLVKVKRGLMFV